MTEKRQHAYTTEDEDPNPAPETSHAERARTLLSLNQMGVLSTHSKICEGFPFGSTMPYALDEAGRPLFLISNMAMHTKNLKADPRASLFVTSLDSDGDPLGAGRLTLVGTTEQVPDEDLEKARAAYLALHENAKYYVDFADFSFWRLVTERLYFVGGFGVMGWVEKTDFDAATADPLAQFAAGIIEHMNTDHEDSMLKIALNQKEIQASEAVMTSVDRLGFDIRLKTPDRMRSVRIAFPDEVRDSDQCRQAFIQLAHQARGTDEATN